MRAPILALRQVGGNVGLFLMSLAFRHKPPKLNS